MNLIFLSKLAELLAIGISASFFIFTRTIQHRTEMANGFKMSPKELALLDQMQRLRYSQGLITTALSILRQSREAQDEMLLYMYEKRPSEKKFVERLAAICAIDPEMRKKNS